MVKIKLQLCLSFMPWRCKGGVEVTFHALWTLTVDVDEWSASHCSHLFVAGGERDYGIHLLGGCVGPGPTLGMMEKKIMFSLCQESNPDHAACSQSLFQLSYTTTIIWLWDDEYQLKCISWDGQQFTTFFTINK